MRVTWWREPWSSWTMRPSGLESSSRTYSPTPANLLRTSDTKSAWTLTRWSAPIKRWKGKKKKKDNSLYINCPLGPSIRIINFKVMFHISVFHIFLSKSRNQLSGRVVECSSLDCNNGAHCLLSWNLMFVVWIGGVRSPMIDKVSIFKDLPVTGTLTLNSHTEHLFEDTVHLAKSLLITLIDFVSKKDIVTRVVCFFYWAITLVS